MSVTNRLSEPLNSTISFIPCRNGSTNLLSSYALDGKAYTIYFFLGDLPARATTEMTGQVCSQAQNCIGSVYTFSSNLEVREGEHCGNCVDQRAAGLLSGAQIPITGMLLSVAKDTSTPELSSLEPDGVQTYLDQQLQWLAFDVSNLNPFISNPYDQLTMTLTSFLKRIPQELALTFRSLFRERGSLS